MATQLNYLDIVKQVLLAYIDFFVEGGVTTLRPLFNDEEQTYLILNVGWREKRYIHNVVVHVDIINNQLWIQKDDTEEGIATDLVEAGIPKHNIVLGFREAEVRPYTGFAVGALTTTATSSNITLPKPDPNANTYVRHTPVAISGKPVSEVVIEQRGAK